MPHTMQSYRACCSSARLAQRLLAKRAAGTTSTRQFHSHEHPTSSDGIGSVERSILAAAYRHVPEHGFSRRSLRLGAQDAGLLDISPSVLPDDVFSLIRFHLVHQRVALADRSGELFGEESEKTTDAEVRKRVASLTWARLLANKDIISKWQDALAIMAQPSCVPASIKELAALSDEILYLSGDKTVDSSWYTKRASLSMIYSTSELYMTNDESPGFVDTQNFLQRRLREAEDVGGFMAAFGSWTKFTMQSGLNVLRSKGAGI